MLAILQLYKAFLTKYIKQVYYIKYTKIVNNAGGEL